MTVLPHDPAALLRLADMSVAAGTAVMRFHAAGSTEVEHKADGSPLTAGDLAAEAVVAEGLARAFAGVPGEAAVEAEGAWNGGTFLMVDPLDGTKEFPSRTGEFTVNIAVVADGRPRAGVVYAPALGRLWLGALGVGAGAMDVAPVPAGEACPAPRCPIRARQRLPGPTKRPARR